MYQKSNLCKYQVHKIVWKNVCGSFKKFCQLFSESNARVQKALWGFYPKFFAPKNAQTFQIVKQKQTKVAAFLKPCGLEYVSKVKSVLISNKKIATKKNACGCVKICQLLAESNPQV